MTDVHNSGFSKTSALLNEIMVNANSAVKEQKKDYSESTASRDTKKAQQKKAAEIAQKNAQVAEEARTLQKLAQNKFLSKANLALEDVSYRPMPLSSQDMVDPSGKFKTILLKNAIVAEEATTLPMAAQAIPEGYMPKAFSTGGLSVNSLLSALLYCINEMSDFVAENTLETVQVGTNLNRTNLDATSKMINVSGEQIDASWNEGKNAADSTRIQALTSVIAAGGGLFSVAGAFAMSSGADKIKVQNLGLDPESFDTLTNKPKMKSPSVDDLLKDLSKAAGKENVDELVKFLKHPEIPQKECMGALNEDWDESINAINSDEKTVKDVLKTQVFTKNGKQTIQQVVNEHNENQKKFLDIQKFPSKEPEKAEIRDQLLNFENEYKGGLVFDNPEQLSKTGGVSKGRYYYVVGDGETRTIKAVELTVKAKEGGGLELIKNGSDPIIKPAPLFKKAEGAVDQKDVFEIKVTKEYGENLRKKMCFEHLQQSGNFGNLGEAVTQQLNVRSVNPLAKQFKEPPKQGSSSETELTVFKRKPEDLPDTELKQLGKTSADEKAPALQATVKPADAKDSVSQATVKPADAKDSVSQVTEATEVYAKESEPAKSYHLLDEIKQNMGQGVLDEETIKDVCMHAKRSEFITKYKEKLKDAATKLASKADQEINEAQRKHNIFSGFAQMMNATSSVASTSFQSTADAQRAAAQQQSALKEQVSTATGTMGQETTQVIQTTTEAAKTGSSNVQQIRANAGQALQSVVASSGSR